MRGERAEGWQGVRRVRGGLVGGCGGGGVGGVGRRVSVEVTSHGHLTTFRVTFCLGRERTYFRNCRL